MEFTPHGVCSKNIHLEVDEAGRIHNVEFTGGCNGNLQGIGRLVEGMDIHKQFHVSKVSNADTKQHPARISFHLL